MKFILFFLSPLFFNTKALSLELSFQESVSIDRPIDKVFRFAGDAINDEKWRTEVHSITAEGPFTVGSVYIEDAFLGFHYNYITKVKISEIEAPFLAFYETTIDNPFKLKSQRTFMALDEESTQFTYTVYVEEALIYDIMFNNIPLKIAENGYRALMRIYLKNLKRRLESIN